METPRATVLPLDVLERRAHGVREPLGEVFGGAMVTLALSGDTVAMDGLKTTASVRERLAERASRSPCCVVLLKDGEPLSAGLNYRNRVSGRA